MRERERLAACSLEHALSATPLGRKQEFGSSERATFSCIVRGPGGAPYPEIGDVGAAVNSASPARV